MVFIKQLLNYSSDMNRTLTDDVECDRILDGRALYLGVVGLTFEGVSVVLRGSRENHRTPH